MLLVTQTQSFHSGFFHFLYQRQSTLSPISHSQPTTTVHILSESLNMSPTLVPSHQCHHVNIPRHSSSSSSSSSTIISISPNKLMPRSTSATAHQMQPFMYLSSSSLSSSSFSASSDDDAYSLPLVVRNWGSRAAAAASPFKLFSSFSSVASMFRSFIPALQSLLIPTCHWLAVAPPNRSPVITQRGSSRQRLLIGTFFGQKKGRVSFAVQETPRSEPLLLLELATPTSHLVKEMASGMVRILLECQRTTTPATKNKKALWDEPVWTMYCNGHKLGYATSRNCTSSDFHVLSTVQTVSVGAGVMPAAMPLLPLPPHAAVKNSDCGGAHSPHPEIMYMRAKFDRVIGSRDSEAFYMINPDCSSSGDGGKFNSGGPELSIFMLRI